MYIRTCKFLKFIGKLAFLAQLELLCKLEPVGSLKLMALWENLLMLTKQLISGFAYLICKKKTNTTFL